MGGRWKLNMAMKEELRYGVTWQADDDVKGCPLCESEFGVFKRKHHCRFCGLVHCADCMKNKAAHPKTSLDEQICDKCHPEHESICAALAIEEPSEEPSEELIPDEKGDGQPCREQQLIDLFAKIDVNGDDALQVSELAAVFGEYHEEFVSFLDKDADSKINVQEWVQGIILETKEMLDTDFQIHWIERMEKCIGERVEAPAEAEEPAEKLAVMSYKEFIASLDDDIEPDEAQKQYKEYKSKLPKEEDPVVPDPAMSEKFGVAWQPDIEAVDCPCCEVEFGVFTRKHHCRFCGLIACASCSDQKEEHPMTKTTEKCCNQCFQVFETERAAMAEDEEAAGGEAEEEEEAEKDEGDKFGVEWQADNEVTKCPLCETDFGVFTRKHHCRFCGKVVCADCNKNKSTHPMTETEESQCSKCEKEVGEQAEKKRLNQRTSRAEL